MRAAPVIVAGALLALAPAASAQVSVNPGALDALPRAQTAPHRRAPARTHQQPAKPPSRNGQKPATPPAPQAAPAPARPSQPEKPPIPPIPPAILALPPPVAVPLAQPPPTPTVPVAPDAAGLATPITGGVRITFGPDSANLNPATEAALRSFARSVKDNEGASINVYAYAAGSTEDPSTPRRLSLSRARAARAALMAEGIPSARIYPRALGPAGGETDRDRVDVVTGQPGPPPASGVAP